MPMKRDPIWFEDFDINFDGIIDVLDITAFTNRGDIPESMKEVFQQKASDIILGHAPIPFHKDPIFFEDYDLNGDGIIDILDVVIWVNAGRPAIADRVGKFISGEIPAPPSRYGG